MARLFAASSITAAAWAARSAWEARRDLDEARSEFARSCSAFEARPLSTRPVTRSSSRVSRSISTCTVAISDFAADHDADAWRTLASTRRLSSFASTWPLTTVSPTFTGSSTRSPERFELIFTVVAASTFPAPVTVRVMGPFFTLPN